MKYVIATAAAFGALLVFGTIGTFVFGWRNCFVDGGFLWQAVVAGTTVVVWSSVLRLLSRSSRQPESSAPRQAAPLASPPSPDLNRATRPPATPTPITPSGNQRPPATIFAVAAATMVLTLLTCAAFFFIQRNARYTTVCFGKDGPFGITFNAENGQFWYGGIYKIQYNDTELRIYHLKASQSPEAILNGVKGLQVYRDCRSFSDLPPFQPIQIAEYRASTEAAKKARDAQYQRLLNPPQPQQDGGRFVSAPGQTGVVHFKNKFDRPPNVEIFFESYNRLSVADAYTAVISVTTSNFTWKNSGIPGAIAPRVYESQLPQDYGGTLTYRAISTPNE